MTNENNLYHPMLLKNIHCSLVYTEEQKRHFGQYMRCFMLSDPPMEVASVLREALSIHVHPDGFDYCIDVLQVLHEKFSLPVRLFILDRIRTI